MCTFFQEARQRLDETYFPKGTVVFKEYIVEEDYSIWLNLHISFVK